MPSSQCTAAKGGSAGPSEKVATPATTECEVELVEGRRIISNELETKRRARENIGDVNGSRMVKKTNDNRNSNCNYKFNHNYNYDYKEIILTTIILRGGRGERGH